MIEKEHYKWIEYDAWTEFCKSWDRYIWTGVWVEPKPVDYIGEWIKSNRRHLWMFRKRQIPIVSIS